MGNDAGYPEEFYWEKCENDPIRRGDAVTLIHKVADGYSSAGDNAIAWGILLTAGNVAALPAVTVGVKRLVWVKSEVYKSLSSQDGGYTVQQEFDVRGVTSWALGQDGILICDYETEGEAIAAAQIHYDGSIIAALEPSPAPTLVEALELLASHVRRMGQEEFLQFAYLMDNALDTDNPITCAADLAAVKGGA
jgi:hypothetical protein